MEEIWLQSVEQQEPIVPFGGLGQEMHTSQVFLYGIFSALMTRSMEMGQDIQEELESYGLTLPTDSYRMVLFALEGTGSQELTGPQRHRLRINVYAALRERLLDLLPPESQGLLVLQLGWLLGLVYLPEHQDATLREACSQMVEYANSLGFSVHATISDRRDTVTEIQHAYASAANFETSRSFFADPTDRIYCVPDNVNGRLMDGEQRTQFEAGFDQTAERICGAVRALDPVAATGYMQEQLQKIALNCKGMPWPAAFNITINRFISQLQFRLTEQELADWRFLSVRDFSRDLVGAGTMEAYLSAGGEIAAQLVEHHRLRSTDRHINLMLDIRAFIENNATDMNMGLTAIAREFHMKPREIAESFRRQFGESVNDVLHRARVKRAKELLLTTNDSVQDIAQQVGYCSLATMYRAFTNVEGIAPGKLRQNVTDDAAG